MSIFEKMKKAGTLKSTSLKDSDVFNVKDEIPTRVPIINMALSGSILGGLTSGLTFLAGPSRNFKSLLGLLLVGSYLNKYNDSICLFYDTEFGITQDYVKSNDIDMERVIHIPVVNIEELKFDITNRLDKVERGDKVIIFIDSIGNLASKKEIDDALDEKTAADMTRAKVLKSLWRIVTPHLTIKDIPCVVINHVYKEMSMFPKDIMSGGTGGMLSANQVLFISKAQEKAGTDLIGYNFTLIAEKSRFVREKSKFTFTVTWERGIEKYSGLMDLAVEAEFVDNSSKGWYNKIDKKTGEIFAKKRLAETMTPDFWDSILKNEEFQEFIRRKFSVSYVNLLGEENG